MTRVTDEPALVLHTRPYEDNGLMVDLLTLHEGRLSAIKKGVRGKSQGNNLQVFSLLLASWYGRGEMMTLTKLNDVRNHWLSGETAAAAYYIVELIVRTVREREPVPLVFASACNGIAELAAGRSSSLVLRPFEQQLLTELGYGLDFAQDVTGAPIQAAGCYRLLPSLGFERLEQAVPGSVEHYAGVHLLAIAEADFSGSKARAAAKRIFQSSLQPLLGEQPLRSRDLLQPAKDQPGLAP